MDVKFINPFIESVYETLSTMLKSGAERGKIALSQNKPDVRSIVAVIGMSGSVKGSVALHLPTATAVAAVNRLLDTNLRVVDDLVLDGVAELVNIIAGGAKAKLSLEDMSAVNLSIPTVIRGRDYRVNYPENATWLEVPFESDIGPFSLRVSIVQEAFNKTGA